MMVYPISWRVLGDERGEWARLGCISILFIYAMFGFQSTALVCPPLRHLFFGPLLDRSPHPDRKYSLNLVYRHVQRQHPGRAVRAARMTRGSLIQRFGQMAHRRARHAKTDRRLAGMAVGMPRSAVSRACAVACVLATSRSSLFRGFRTSRPATHAAHLAGNTDGSGRWLGGILTRSPNTVASRTPCNACGSWAASAMSWFSRS